MNYHFDMPQTGVDYATSFLAQGQTFTIHFAHVGRVTSATVTWEEGNRLKASGGASYCNPADTYDQEIGDRLALRRALRIGQDKYWVTHPLAIPVAREIFQRYRELRRFMDEERVQCELEAEEI